MAELTEMISEKMPSATAVKEQNIPHFYHQLFSEWKDPEAEETPFERDMRTILLDHFLPGECD